MAKKIVDTLVAAGGSARLGANVQMKFCRSDLHAMHGYALGAEERGQRFGLKISHHHQTLPRRHTVPGREYGRARLFIAGQEGPHIKNIGQHERDLAAL